MINRANGDSTRCRRCGLLLYVVLIYLPSLTTAQIVSHSTDSVERELQKTVERKLEFEKLKRKQIFELKEKLGAAPSLQTRYQIQKALYQAFRTFQIDSAIFYVQANNVLAKTMEDD